MPIKYTKTGRKFLRKAESLWVLPYIYDSTLQDYVLGQNLYDLSAIIGDSIMLEQSDGETESKINEFSGEPVVENVTSGEWKFTAQCLDLQNEVLKALFGAYYNTSKGVAAMQRDTPTLYAMIRIRFTDPQTPDVYLPKVLLNSKLLLQQMKTRGSQGNISGTAVSYQCAVIDSATSHTLCQFTDSVNNEAKYIINSPVLFVPQGVKPLFFNHENEDAELVFDELQSVMSDNQDCCAHNRVVSDINSGVYTIS